MTLALECGLHADAIILYQLCWYGDQCIVHCLVL